jgi:uncharacterized protein (TIGR03083 family)
VEPYDLLAALARDGEAFADACADADLNIAVPTCPGWSLADLVWHLAEVHHFWRTIVDEQRDTWEGYEQPPRPPDGALVDFYRDGLEATVTVLAAAHPQRANWTWSHQRDAGFVMRRMAQETAVHLFDACAARGGQHTVAADLASDGIDEFLFHFLRPDANFAGALGGSVHIHCTDVAGEWTVRPADSADAVTDASPAAGSGAGGGAEEVVAAAAVDDDGDGDGDGDGRGLVVTREHSKGDAALRGAASNLLLVLWRRLPLAAVDVIGDHDLAARFVACTSLD